METTRQFVGEVIGNYRVLAELGSGGMGTVYRAQDTRLDRQVALKLLPDASLFEKDSIDRFRHEARAASSLNHPNI
jgi:serine/threonine protein kinase